MLLSIIIPTRNEAHNIAACLSPFAAAAQAGQCERIVVDNDSSDGTADLARAAGAAVYRQGPERSAQRNRGVREARGEYVFFLDADMRVPDATLREILELLVAPDAPDGLYIPEIRAGRGWWGRVRNFERSFYNGTCIDALRVMRRETLLAAGGYDEALYAGEDWDLDLRFLAIASRTAITRGALTHDEGRFTLGRHLAKKRYYSENLSRYRQKWPGNAVVRRQFSLTYGKRQVAAQFATAGSPVRRLARPPVGGGAIRSGRGGPVARWHKQVINRRFWAHRPRGGSLDARDLLRWAYAAFASAGSFGKPASNQRLCVSTAHVNRSTSIRRNSRKPRQPRAVRFDQVVAQVANLVDGKFAGGVGVEHGGLVDAIAAAFQHGLDGQHLHVDVGAVVGRAHLGQIADVASLHAIGVHQAGDLDASLGRQVRDEPAVEHVAADFGRLVGLNGLDDG
jgi:GT2 family glycosyltransferase